MFFRHEAILKTGVRPKKSPIKHYMFLSTASLFGPCLAYSYRYEGDPTDSELKSRIGRKTKEDAKENTKLSSNTENNKTDQTKVPKYKKE